MRRRYDSRLLLAHNTALEDVAALADPRRLTSCSPRLADEELPEAIDSDDGVLPLERERLALSWGEYVRRSPPAERK